MRVLANVVPVSDVIYLLITHVTNSAYTKVPGSLVAIVLERQAFTAYLSRRNHLALEAPWAAVVVAVSVRVFTSVSTGVHIKIVAADVAASGCTSEIISTHSWKVSLL